MSGPIERPVFFEGQILGAADLTATVEYSRNQEARHERYLHLWGIAAGLDLTGVAKKDSLGQAYQEVTLSAGVAIDGRGREVVVPENERLSETLFDELHVAVQDPTALYPVFLIGRDQTSPQAQVPTRACDNSEPTRQTETYVVTFGRPGEEAELEKQTGAAVGESLDDLKDAPPWKILLGFVEWGAALGIKRFTAFDVVSKEGIARRYAGVQADVVAARSGSLTLRTRADNQAGMPGMIMDEKNGGGLQFGLLTAQGNVTPLLTVNSKGDLTVTGKLSSAVAPGSVQVQSGVAMDGILVPLPPGITQAMVDSGKVALHVHLAPQIPGTPPNSTAIWGAFPLECTTDKDLRIRCRIRWSELGTSTLNLVDLPAPCNYLVIASVAATTGTNP